jgi:hypothetical protein
MFLFFARFFIAKHEFFGTILVGWYALGPPIAQS